MGGTRALSLLAKENGSRLTMGNLWTQIPRQTLGNRGQDMRTLSKERITTLPDNTFHLWHDRNMLKLGGKI